MAGKFVPIIGLEVHIEPTIKTKMFCRCLADHFGKKPNTQVCPICLGLPGALPFTNWGGVESVIKLGLAVGSSISNTSKFYRKNYFYPDLPKSYQTSQLDSPFCIGGNLLGKRINHIHLEEDAGKLVHETIDGKKYSLVDFNRSGVALIEMVTEPDFHSVSEVIAFLKEVQLIARYLGVSNADMEKGSMRLEANISMSPDGNLPNYKIEIKNINSYKFLEKAINAELIRQEKMLSNGEIPEQETRGFDEVKQITFSQRSKADAHDYRYFPEADLPPIKISEDDVARWKAEQPELPNERRYRFKDKYALPDDFVEILVSDKLRSDYFEECIRVSKQLENAESITPKFIADLLIIKNMDYQFPEPAGLVKKVLEISKVQYSSPEEVKVAVMNVLAEQQKAVKDYKDGNGNVVGFLIGMTQKKLQGKGNPKTVSEIIIKELQNGR